MKKNKSRFIWKKFLALLILSLSVVMAWETWESQKQSELPPSSTQELVTSKELISSQKEDKKPKTEPVQSAEEEVNALQTLLNERKAQALAAEREANGELLVDETYGGALEPQNGEKPIAVLEVPTVGLKRDVYRGVGQSSTGVTGAGDTYRLNHAVTWRANQTLGGDNFTISSHVWTGEIGVNGETFENEWFSPLLSSVDGGITTNPAKFKLKKGDKITITELGTNYLFTFEVSEIVITGKSGEAIDQQAFKMLSARTDKPRATLQGCLQGESNLVFVVGELKNISYESKTLSVE